MTKIVDSKGREYKSPRIGFVPEQAREVQKPEGNYDTANVTGSVVPATLPWWQVT